MLFCGADCCSMTCASARSLLSISMKTSRMLSIRIDKFRLNSYSSLWIICGGGELKAIKELRCMFSANFSSYLF